MRIWQFRRRAPGMPRWRVALVWVLFWSITRFVFIVWFGLRTYGRHLVPRRGPIIFVANHQSHLDPPLVGVLAGDRPCAFLARSTLFHNRLFGAFIRLLNAVPLEREGSAAGAMRAAMRELEAGRCVLLFPEGTRSRDGALGAFKPGMLLLVRRSRAPVVPIAIEGALDAWPRTRALPHFTGRIALAAGAPIPAEELITLAPADAMELIKRRIEAMRLELGKRLSTPLSFRADYPTLFDERM